MLKKNTIFDYFANVLIIYSISVISIVLFCILFGEHAKGVSSIFSLGNTGISINTLVEFFALSVAIVGMRWLFFTDSIIKNLSITVRSILMFSCVIILVGVFAAIFKWFPVNMPIPWIMFFICFFVCALISTFISMIKEKNENKKIQDALNKLKEEKF